jgi:hypothetical protein
MTQGNNKIILIILLATFFGFGSGIVGAIVTRVYILENALNFPLFGEIDFSSPSFNGSNLVIRDAKKVVVEQNDKIKETINSVKNNIVGIYEKKATSSVGLKNTTGTEFSADNFYNTNEVLGQAFIITSDGWLISSFAPAEFSDLKKDIEKEKNGSLINSTITKKYVAISKNKEIYEIDQVIFNNNSDYSFWHIKADGLPVKKFIASSEVNNGDLVVSINWHEWAWVSSIVEKNYGEKSLVNDSDLLLNNLKLDKEPSKDFFGSFIFNLNGEAVALINQEGKVEPIYNYTSCINCLLKTKIIQKPSLGLYFIDLSDFVSFNGAKLTKGALVTKNELGVALKKNSPASKAGIKEGDIIVSINNIELDKNNTLPSIVNQYQVGDELDVVYEREGLKKNLIITLGKLE